MTEMEEELRPCTVCGKPVLWGTRHPVCGQRVMAAEPPDLRAVLKDMVALVEWAMGDEPDEPKGIDGAAVLERARAALGVRVLDGETK